MAVQELGPSALRKGAQMGWANSSRQREWLEVSDEAPRSSSNSTRCRRYTATISSPKRPAYAALVDRCVCRLALRLSQATELEEFSRVPTSSRSCPWPIWSAEREWLLGSIGQGAEDRFERDAAPAIYRYTKLPK